MNEPTLAETKIRLRGEGFARRDALDAPFRADASRAICDLILGLPELARCEPVGAYWPIRSEVDPRPALEGVSARGRIAALSQVRHPLLSWREWRPGDVLVHGGFGVREPGPDAPEVYPHALLVPLCAFDRRGGRLGYGKGHFDRSIAALAGRHALVTIGLAFAAQEVERVPMGEHDRFLDLVVTEQGVIRPAGQAAS